MRSLHVFVVAVSMAAGISVSAASAAPAPRLDTQVAGELNLLKKVHGWHRYCAWGAVRYHRHVPDVGNVPCHRPYRHRRHWERDNDDHNYNRYRNRRHHQDQNNNNDD